MSTKENIFYRLFSFNVLGSNDATKNSEKFIDFVLLKSNLDNNSYANSFPYNPYL